MNKSPLKHHRPKLLLEGATVRVALELSDLTHDVKSKCLAVQSLDTPECMLMSAVVSASLCNQL